MVNLILKTLREEIADIMLSHCQSIIPINNHHIPDRRALLNMDLLIEDNNNLHLRNIATIRMTKGLVIEV